MKTPRLSEVIQQLQAVHAKHGDIEFWIQVHHPDRPMNYGERGLSISVDHIPPTDNPPVYVLHMNA